MKNNPGQLKQFGDRPLRVGGSVVTIPHNEVALKAMLNTTIDNMIYTGAIDRIVKDHMKYENSVMLPASPFRPVE